MAKIVQSLLLFSRQRKPERRLVELRPVIQQILSLRDTQLVLSSIRLETEFADDVPPVEGDPHQLQQVFLNLILNAEQAILGSGVGGRRIGDCIRVATDTRREGDQVWVVAKIADNGPGIPAEVLPRIFEPFFTTKRVGASASRPAAAGKGRRVLVVDDEPAVVEMMTSVLDRQGWRVDVAGGGREGLDLVRAARYDLVLSDIRMPELEGAGFYRAAVAEQHELASRFLFMTGDTANREAWQFLQETRAPVLEKPVTPHALLHAVDRVSA